MPDVITLGETLVVFDSIKQVPLRYATNFDCHTGGAETNVAVGVVRLGHSAGWISRLGDDEFGCMICRVYRGEGVDISRVSIDPKQQTGVFFRNSLGNGEFNNYYYRKNSAASMMTPEMLDEEYIRSCKYLHVSGINLAISETMAKTVERAMEIAKENNVKVSFDPNLRLKMWNSSDAKKAIGRLWHLIDIALPGFEEGQILFDTDDPDKMSEVMQRSGVGSVIIKLGKDGAIGYRKNEKVISSGFNVSRVIDVCGAGDAFAAGIISGQLKGLDLTETLCLANAVGAISVSGMGNIECLPTYKEVLSYMNKETKPNR